MRIRVVLVETEGEANLGMIARLADNFCVDELYLVSPRTRIGDEAFRYAVKGAHRLGEAIIVKSLDEALEDVELSLCSTAVHRDDDLLRRTIGLKDVVGIIDKSKPKSIALVFGRESTGLTRRELALCDIRFTIETCPRYSTLNLANSVAITLYEVGKNRFSVSREPVTSDTMLRKILVEIMGSLADHVYRDENKRRDAVLVAQRLVDPRFTGNKDLGVLTSLLSRVKKKLERCNE